MKFKLSQAALLKRNIIANFAGSSFATILGLLFTPVYLYFLGIEAYALIGFSLLLQGMLQVLDVGLSKTSNREIARLSGMSDFGQNAALMLRTFEFIYWGIALLIAVSIIGLSSWIATNWLSYSGLMESDVKYAMALMGINLALQWPVSLYSGGLLGLEKHVLLNSIISSQSLLRHVGASLLLWLVEPSITIFFIWSSVVSLLQVLVLAFSLWKLIHYENTVVRKRFDISILMRVWRFSASVAATQLSAVAIRQVDKLVLSKLLSLEWFGFYMLASLVASGIGIISMPFSKALFPRFTKLVANKGSKIELTKLYHESCRVVSMIVFPIVIVVSLYSEEVLLLWTQNEYTASSVAPILCLLVISSGLNALVSIPYALQLAYGWSSLAMFQNFISLCIQVPLIFYFINTMGVQGAAVPRIIHNLSYIFILVPIMHMYVQKGELLEWYIRDIFAPLFNVLIVCIPIYFAIMSYPEISKWPAIMVSLMGSYLVLYLCGGFQKIFRDMG